MVKNGSANGEDHDDKVINLESRRGRIGGTLKRRSQDVFGAKRRGASSGRANPSSWKARINVYAQFVFLMALMWLLLRSCQF